MLNWLLRKVPEWCKKHDRKRVILDRLCDSDYMTRYYILFKDRPSWFPFNIVLHNMHRSDLDDLHDHPWPYATMILKGGYWEETPEGRFWRKPGHFRFKSAKSFHRLEIDKAMSNGEETWTLFFMGSRVREWGFMKNGIWVQWQEYINGMTRVERGYKPGEIKPFVSRVASGKSVLNEKNSYQSTSN